MQVSDKKNRRIRTLYSIVCDGLALPESGLNWIKPNYEFALNIHLFSKYYQKMRKSSAKWEDIKKRMTNKKSGFIVTDKVPPQGYDMVYTHISWNVQPDRSLPEQPVSLISNIESYPGQESELTMIFNAELIPFTLLKRQPIHVNVWQSYQFSISHFIKELRSISELNMSDYDKTYFEILLPAETGTSSDLMPTNALHEFGIRFGPWIRIVEQIRNFVADGARHWFYGKCDSKQAIEILSKNENDRAYYLIRSVPVVTEPNPDRKYVFAISYRKKNGAISHFKIYKDISDRLCMVNNANEVEYFTSFRDIIAASVEHDTEPYTNPYFKGLVTQPVRVFPSDDPYPPLQQTSPVYEKPPPKNDRLIISKKD